MHFSKHILPNGIRVITVPIKGHPTVTVEVFVEVGSKYETKPESGISHFLEHMCFKGTKKRPSVLAVTRELDSIGAQYNATTSQEWTGYYAKCDARHFDIALDVVSDIYLNSTLPESEMEKEKGVIVEEINMYEDLPQRKVQDIFMELLYGDTPAGRDIAGTRENVRSFTHAALTGYRARHYVSDATTVIVAGNIDEKTALEKVTRMFASAARGEKGDKEKVMEAQKKPAAKVFFKETDQAHFVLGVRTFDTHDERNPVLRVLSAVLGGGMSSRLFQKVRDQMGAAYYVGAAPDSFTDHGFFEVAAGVDQKRVPEVVTAVLDELSRLTKEAVSEAELKKAKEYLNGTMYLSLETSDAVADFYGYQEVMRKVIKTPDEVRARVNAVDAASIRELAQELFVDRNLNFSLIGRFKDAGEFERALSF